MSIETIRERIENSALAQRPLWLTILCGVVALLSAVAGVGLIGLSMVRFDLVSARLSHWALAYSIVSCALHVVGAVALWRFRLSTLVVWPLVLVLVLTFEVAFAPGEPNLKSLLVPALMLAVAAFYRNRLA